MKSKLIAILVVLFFFSIPCLAACPTADLNGDCFVDFSDFAVLASQWLTDGFSAPDVNSPPGAGSPPDANSVPDVNSVRCNCAPTGYCALGFDDGTVDHYTTVAPLLEQLQVGATFFIISGRIDSNDTTYLTTAQVLALSQMDKMEIGSHSKTHPDFTTLTKAAMQTELADSRSVLEAIINKPVRTFAYPFGAWNATTNIIAARNYDRIASYTWISNGGDGSMLSRTGVLIRRTAVSAPGATYGLEWAKSEMRRTAGICGSMSLSMHQVVESGATGNQMNAEDLIALVNYAKSLGLAVGPVGKMPCDFDMLDCHDWRGDSITGADGLTAWQGPTEKFTSTFSIDPTGGPAGDACLDVDCFWANEPAFLHQTALVSASTTYRIDVPIKIRIKDPNDDPRVRVWVYCRDSVKNQLFMTDVDASKRFSGIITDAGGTNLWKHYYADITTEATGSQLEITCNHTGSSTNNNQFSIGRIRLMRKDDGVAAALLIDP